MTADATPIWSPTAERRQAAQITLFRAWLRDVRGVTFDDYEALWSWSVSEPEAFWSSVWDYFGIVASKPYVRVRSPDDMPGTRWFEGAELNFVDQVFRHRSRPGAALIHQSEAGAVGEVSWAELERQVSALAHTLRGFGVVRGDRVVGYLPNIPHAVVAFLATASIGAIWSICAPDIGPVSVVDRFSQIGPKVVIACDGYRFGGRAFDRREALGGILKQLPSIEAVIWVEHLAQPAEPPSALAGRRTVAWQDAVAGQHELRAEAMPADHPLWILYSSGTTGLPKPIVHGHGGIVANGILTTAVHSDVQAGDRVFWMSSTSWMVWNAHILCLCLGATLVLFDGSPTGPGEKADWAYLWKLADSKAVTMFGGGAAFYHSCLKSGIVPRRIAQFEALRNVTSTGSPLSAEGYRWLYEAVKSDLWVNSTSGGTDICGAFVGGVPSLPVYVGEIQCRVLGAAVAAYDDAGASVIDQVGELVCEQPVPSMPLFFWGDSGNHRYLESYFDTFARSNGGRIWRHGDWIKLVPRPGAVGSVIYGRSDATINRQGVRMGTAELYRAVEAFDEILDSMVVDLEYLGRDSYLALFVVLRDGASLTPELDRRLKVSIREALSPRHVPNEILSVPAVPRTLTGKKLELPIKKLLLGHPIEKVVTRDALANAASLDWYIEFARRRAAGTAGSS